MGHDGETCQILSLAPPSHVAAVQYFGRHPTRRLPAKCDSCRWDLVRGLPGDLWGILQIYANINRGSLAMLTFQNFKRPRA